MIEWVNVWGDSSKLITKEIGSIQLYYEVKTQGNGIFANIHALGASNVVDARKYDSIESAKAACERHFERLKEKIMQD